MSEAEMVLRAMAAQIEALEQRLAEQQQDMLQQQAEVAALRAQVEATAPANQSSAAAPAVKRSRAARRTSSRRQLFVTAGAAAAVATAAAVLVEPDNVARAASGDNWVLGQTNDAGATTSLLNSSGTAPSPMLNVQTSGATVSISGASTTAGGTGVLGTCSGLGSTGVMGTSFSGGTGVAGFSDTAGVAGVAYSGGTGVSGTSSTGPGMAGTSTSAAGLSGTSSTGPGLSSSSTNGAGVFATSTSNSAIIAEGGTYGAKLQGTTAPVELVPLTFAGAPTTGVYFQGDILVDKNGVVWTCVSGDGTSLGTWVRLTRVASGSHGGATTYLSKPIRLLDTRPGAADALHTGGGPYAATGSPYSLTIAGATFSGVTIPSGAVGAIGNVTALGTAAGTGHLAVVTHGAGNGLGVVQYAANQVVENSFNVLLGSGQVDLYIGGNPANVILDVWAVVS